MVQVVIAVLIRLLLILQAGSAECTPCLSLRSDFMQAQPSGYSCHFPVSAAGATTCCESKSEDPLSLCTCPYMMINIPVRLQLLGKQPVHRLHSLASSDVTVVAEGGSTSWTVPWVICSGVQAASGGDERRRLHPARATRPAAPQRQGASAIGAIGWSPSLCSNAASRGCFSWLTHSTALYASRMQMLCNVAGALMQHWPTAADQWHEATHRLAAAAVSVLLQLRHWRLAWNTLKLKYKPWTVGAGVAEHQPARRQVHHGHAVPGFCAAGHAAAEGGPLCISLSWRFWFILRNQASLLQIAFDGASPGQTLTQRCHSDYLRSPSPQTHHPRCDSHTTDSCVTAACDQTLLAISCRLLTVWASSSQRALVPGTAATLAVIQTPMPGGGVELQFDVPSAFPSGSVLLTGHYLDNRWVPAKYR
jgi:hypothetical protein